MDNNILIIGAGNLGSEIALSYNDCHAGKRVEKIYIYDINQKKQKFFESSKHIVFVKDLSNALKKSKFIILAIKPKDYKNVCVRIKDELKKNTIVMSVMAGVKINSLRKELPSSTQFVRLMTNLNIKVFQGTSFIYASNKIINIDKNKIEKFWGRMGSVHWLKSESNIDKFTALIGSGPAYFIYFCECLVKVFKDFGLAEKDAKIFVYQLFFGTALLCRPSNGDPKFRQWKNMIASKGGTTQEALNILEKGKLTSILNNSIKAAYKKAKSLEGK